MNFFIQLYQNYVRFVKMIKKLFKRIPIVRRIYPSIFKRLYNFLNIEKINYEYLGLKFIGNINEPMDKEILLFNEYEHLQIEYLLKLIKISKFDYFIDVGANSGLYSMIIAKNNNKIKVKSFEPIKKTILKFKENILLNKNLNNIQIFEFGLSNKNSKLLMKSLKKKDYIQTGGFGVVKDGEILKNLHTEYAEFKKGDDVLSLKNKNIVLKVDAEGHEKEVLEGMENNLDNNKILLQIEIFDKNFENINKILKVKNFNKINIIQSDGKKDYFFKNY